MVSISTPTLRRSVIAARISSSVSPIPAMSPDLATSPARFARASTVSERA